MARGLPMVLILFAACSEKPAIPPKDLARVEGLSFPDLSSVERRLADRPAALELRREGAPPDRALPDGPRADSWPGGPCFHSWAVWKCMPVLTSFCLAECGSDGLQILCGTSCTCTKAGVRNTCPTVAGTACAKCRNAFEAGCCSF